MLKEKITVDPPPAVCTSASCSTTTSRVDCIANLPAGLSTWWDMHPTTMRAYVCGWWIICNNNFSHERLLSPQVISSRAQYTELKLYIQVGISSVSFWNHVPNWLSSIQQKYLWEAFVICGLLWPLLQNVTKVWRSTASIFLWMGPSYLIQLCYPWKSLPRLRI